MSHITTLNGNSSFSLISKYRPEIYGIAALWIVFLHEIAFKGMGEGISNIFLRLLIQLLREGDVGVDVFIFLSGVSLYFALEKKPTMGHFLLRRFDRVLIAVFIIYGTRWIIQAVYYQQDWHLVAMEFSLTQFWIIGRNDGTWYVSLLLPLYVLYPSIHGILFAKDRHSWLASWTVVLIGLSVLLYSLVQYANPDYFSNVEGAFRRIPTFLLGCAFGRVVYEHRHGSPLLWGISILSCVAYFYFKHSAALQSYAFWKLVYVPAGLGFSYVFAFICHLFDISDVTLLHQFNRFFRFLGRFSLELYLIHLAFMTIADLFGIPSRNAFALIWIVVSIAGAWAVSKVAANLSRRVENKAFAKEPENSSSLMM